MSCSPRGALKAPQPAARGGVSEGRAGASVAIPATAAARGEPQRVTLSPGCRGTAAPLLLIPPAEAVQQDGSASPVVAWLELSAGRAGACERFLCRVPWGSEPSPCLGPLLNQRCELWWSPKLRGEEKSHRCSPLRFPAASSALAERQPGRAAALPAHFPSTQPVVRPVRSLSSFSFFTLS